MADDAATIYKSSPNWEQGIVLGGHDSYHSYKILNLTNIPVYDNYTYFIVEIYNVGGVSGVNIRNEDNKKCFIPVNPSNWGGWGRAAGTWANVGCWAICSLGSNSRVKWKIKIPMI